MTATRDDLRQQVLAVLDTLPDEALAEVAAFVDFQRYKLGRPAAGPPYRPIALGGIWKGIDISDEDIAEARREMWGRNADPEP